MVRLRTRPGLQDSPSRQLLRDLAKELEQVRVHNRELKLVKAYERKTFYETLDRLDREREAIHYAALDAAAARHEQIRKEAEEVLAAHLKEEEEKRKRHEEEERLRKEREEAERRERERREREEKERLEAERREKEEEERRLAAQRKAAEEEKARLEAERVAAEKKRQEEEQKKKEEEEAKHKAQEEEKAQLEQQTFMGASRRTPQERAEHQRYLELHQHLKKFRKYMEDQTKTNLVLKEHMGNMRRTIKKCVGQLLTEGKGANRKPMNEVIEILKKALTLSEPSVDVRQFIAFPPEHIANSSDTQVPALMIYLLSIFAKAIVAQLVTEAGVTPKYAEPLGVMTAQIFSYEAFVYRGVSMIDILLAKYRVACPVLFGFYGSEHNDAGKEALGWRREEPNGPFVPRQVHEERMVGLGAGFAAIALRNFSRTPRKNPYPNTNFWKSVSILLSTPVEEVQDTHLVVLNYMLRYSAPRIIRFWGDYGMALLRHAIITFPASLPRQSTASNTLRVLKDIYAQEQNIFL
ncbi:hypothetical protein VTO42DRAFT_2607 [Malbranchea cinnamomea]